MLELLKVQLSRIVLDKVIYNTISCTVFFIKVWYQFQHNFSNTSYFFSLLSIFIFFGKIYRFWPTIHFSWLALKKNIQNPGKHISKFLFKNSHRIRTARSQNCPLILFTLTNSSCKKRNSIFRADWLNFILF